MKVLGLVASPRRNGNSEILVKHMLSSLPDTVEKEMIRLTDLEIKPCNACYACLPEDKNCVINDHLAFLLDKIKTADAVIITSACYFLGSHTSIKTIGDRLISILANGNHFAGKKCITATIYGIPDWEGYAREAVNNFARFLHLDIVGSMLVQAANPGEAVETNYLNEAASLAEKLINPGDSSLKVPGTLICQHCGSSLLQLSTDGQTRCVMCGSKGLLKTGNNGFSLEDNLVQNPRYTAESMAKHCRLLESIKERYIASREDLSARRKPYSKYNSWWVKPE